MTRKQFLEAYQSALREGRVARFPDISPVEQSAASVDDKKEASRIWKRNRLTLSALPVQEFLDNHAKVKTIYDLKKLD